MIVLGFQYSGKMRRRWGGHNYHARLAYLKHTNNLHSIIARFNVPSKSREKVKVARQDRPSALFTLEDSTFFEVHARSGRCLVDNQHLKIGAFFIVLSQYLDRRHLKHAADVIFRVRIIMWCSSSNALQLLSLDGCLRSSQPVRYSE